jgi:hypothetical protein
MPRSMPAVMNLGCEWSADTAVKKICCNALNAFRKWAVGFIDWLDAFMASRTAFSELFRHN